MLEATDRQIDGLVYELYGVAEEKAKAVEGEHRRYCKRSVQVVLKGPDT